MPNELRDKLFYVLAAGLFATAWLFYLSNPSAYETHLFLLPKSFAIAGVGVIVGGLFAIQKKSRVDFEYLDLAVFVFFLYAVTSSFAAGIHWTYAFLWLAEAVALYAVFNATAVVASKAELTDKIMLFIIIAASGIAFCAFLEACLPEMPWAITMKPGSLLCNRNSTATYCAVGMILALIRYLQTRKKFYLPAMTLCSFAVIICRTRGVWLALAALVLTSICIISTKPRYRAAIRGLGRPALYAFAVLSVCAIVFTQISWPQLNWRSDNPYMSSVKKVFAYEEGTGRDRILQHHLGKEIILDSPLFGAGIGGWRRLGPNYEDKVETDQGGKVEVTALSSPASDPLRFISEFGLLGVTLAAWIAYLFLSSILKNGLQGKTISCGAAFLFLGFNAFFDKPLARPQTLYLGILMAGLLRENGQLWASRTFSPAIRAMIGSACLCAFIVLSLHTFSRMQLLQNPTPKGIATSLNIYPDPFFIGLVAKYSQHVDCAEWSDTLPKIKVILPNDKAVVEISQRCGKN